MAMDDLSYLEQLLGTSPQEAGRDAGGVWVMGLEGTLDDGLLRLVGKARVVADALGPMYTCCSRDRRQRRPKAKSPRSAWPVGTADRQRAARSARSMPAPIVCCWPAACRR